MNARGIAAVLGCAALAFVVAGCGDDGGDSEEEQIEDVLEDVEDGEVPDIPQRENACEDVERQDVEDAFGGDVSEPTEDFAGCNFEVTSSDLGVDGSVTVRIELLGAFDPEELFEMSQQAYDAGEVEQVAGLGDDAYYVPTFGAVTVLEGDSVFTVQGVFLDTGTDTTVDEADLQARVVDLAETVAERV